jgi:hypothetical protein
VAKVNLTEVYQEPTVLVNAGSFKELWLKGINWLNSLFDSLFAGYGWLVPLGITFILSLFIMKKYRAGFWMALYWTLTLYFTLRYFGIGGKPL